jgi:hypothetical protein
VTGAKLARASLPARVWITRTVFPVRPWRVMSERGYLMSASTAGSCERWLARYGYVLAERAESDTGPYYMRKVSV